MRKLIVIFLALSGILCALMISYDRKQKSHEVLKENHYLLKKLAKKSERCCAWLQEFTATFQERNFISESGFKKIVKNLCKIQEIELKNLEFNENLACIEIFSESDAKIIGFLRSLLGEELSLAIHPAALEISYQEDGFKSILRVFIPYAKHQPFSTRKEDLLKISARHQNPFGLSLFNRNIGFEGMAKDRVIVNGILFPQNFEDQNFSLMMQDNSTIMLNVKKLKKTFYIKLGVEEIIAP